MDIKRQQQENKKKGNGDEEHDMKNTQSMACKLKGSNKERRVRCVP